MIAPTRERLKEVLLYNPVTGLFTWKIKPNRRIKIGSIAGCAGANGRMVIRVDGVLLHASRLAWLYMTGVWSDLQIDHKDCNPLNNKWENLREATSAQNMANTRKRLRNSTGFKGVVFHQKNKKWVANISHENDRIYIGSFDTREEAHAAYIGAAVALNRKFARSE